MFWENYLIVPSSFAHACFWRHSRKLGSYGYGICYPVKGWGFDTFGPIVSSRNVEKTPPAGRTVAYIGEVFYNSP